MSVREGPAAEENKNVIAEVASLEDASSEFDEDISQEVNARVSERVEFVTADNQLKVNQQALTIEKYR